LFHCLPRNNFTCQLVISNYLRNIKMQELKTTQMFSQLWFGIK
jgi:hypothetical protein